MKLIKNLFWRLQFRKVVIDKKDVNNGRCVKCDAGNPKVECSEHYCPCKENEQLKRIRLVVFLKKNKRVINIDTDEKDNGKCSTCRFGVDCQYDMYSEETHDSEKHCFIGELWEPIK